MYFFFVCVLKTIIDLQNFPYKTRREARLEAQKHTPDEEKQVTSKELLRMSEFNPPGLMAQGNVGTPISTFLQLIRSCRLPPKLIPRLGLQFRRSRRRYGNVQYDYVGTEIAKQEEGVYTATGHEIAEGGSIGSKVLKDEEDIVEESQSDDVSIDLTTSKEQLPFMSKMALTT